jgi:hypothetical protein
LRRRMGSGGSMSSCISLTMRLAEKYSRDLLLDE